MQLNIVAGRNFKEILKITKCNMNEDKDDKSSTRIQVNK